MAFEIAGYTYVAHRVVPRDWGPICQFCFARDDGSHINGVVSVPSLDVSNQDLQALVGIYLSWLKAREDLEATYSHVFDDAGPKVKEALFWLVTKIRQYPQATAAQAETQWDLVWAEGLFDFDRFVAHVQRIAGDVTWDQFKTYVINKKFEGLD